MTSDESMAEKRDCGMDAAAYVLGALEADEAEAFRAHLATCAVCRDEVGAFQEVADALPLLAPAQPVPRGLKRRVMADVRAEPRDTAQPKRRSFRFPDFALRIPGPALAAGAVVLVIAVAAIAVVAIGSGGSGAQTVTASVIGPGSAKIEVKDGRGQLIVHGMPAPPGNDIYEVWLQRGKNPPSPTSALFSVTSEGSGTVAVPGNLDGVDQVLVTPEPPGGSAAPTHMPVIVARLT